MSYRRFWLQGFAVLCLGLQLACNLPLPGGDKKIDDGVILSEKVDVLNSTALVAAKVAQVKKGDKLEILKRLSVNGVEYVKVTVPGEKGTEAKVGWVESRHIISQKILTQCEELAAPEKDTPTQATGRLLKQTNLRIKPGRDTEVVAQLKAGTTFDIVKRERTEYKPPASATAENAPPAGEGDTTRYDDWFLVRFGSDSIFPAGWLYGGSIEITPPEPLSSLVGPGRHATAWAVIGETVDNEGTKQKNYVVLDKSNYNRDDLIEFDRIYAVAWDSATNGYGSIYIESNVRGTYPIRYPQGTNPTEFTLLLLDKANQSKPTKYEIIKGAADGKTRIVKFVEKPAPKPAKPAKKK